MLDVIRLRVLVAVARHGSVTAAARALNYAQPSISHHIARLEAETGARLLQRAGRGVRLTDAGRLLAERAEEIIGRLDAAEAELAAHVGPAAGPGPAGRLPVRAGHDRARRRGPAGGRDAGDGPHADRGRAARGAADAPGRLRGRGPGLPALPAGHRPGAAHAAEEGTRGRLLLDEPVHLVTPASPAPRHRGRPAAGPGRLRRAPVDRRLRAVPQLPDPAVRAGRVHAQGRLHHRRLRGGPGPGGGRPGRDDAARPVPAGRPAPGHRGHRAARRPAARFRGDLRGPAGPARHRPAAGRAGSGGDDRAAPSRPEPRRPGSARQPVRSGWLVPPSTGRAAGA